MLACLCSQKGVNFIICSKYLLSFITMLFSQVPPEKYRGVHLLFHWHQPWSCNLPWLRNVSGRGLSFLWEETLSHLSCQFIFSLCHQTNMSVSGCYFSLHHRIKTWNRAVANLQWLLIWAQNTPCFNPLGFWNDYPWPPTPSSVTDGRIRTQVFCSCLAVCLIPNRRRQLHLS